ncbi:hypothetical protein 3 [Wuhan coneheads virus 2]|uniref:hypothetical protein 3 n=1 Tax=Wuhan coneheads virus 2 TaxID=1923696 RepID=UPI00090C9795|nr:hypothetical protein 3 [Wuhan coneheads virus 2]APG78428.1 hypothetical protein 3 [Wuhan coneheads virus 2]APG78616.1 hypothetical protein 3 [Wuhan coneheads virus 2]
MVSQSASSMPVMAEPVLDEALTTPTSLGNSTNLATTHEIANPCAMVVDNPMASGRPYDVFTWNRKHYQLIKSGKITSTDTDGANLTFVTNNPSEFSGLLGAEANLHEFCTPQIQYVVRIYGTEGIIGRCLVAAGDSSLFISNKFEAGTGLSDALSAPYWRYISFNGVSSIEFTLNDARKDGFYRSMTDASSTWQYLGIFLVQAPRSKYATSTATTTDVVSLDWEIFARYGPRHMFFGPRLVKPTTLTLNFTTTLQSFMPAAFDFCYGSAYIPDDNEKHVTFPTFLQADGSLKFDLSAQSYIGSRKVRDCYTNTIVSVGQVAEELDIISGASGFNWGVSDEVMQRCMNFGLFQFWGEGEVSQSLLDKLDNIKVLLDDTFPLMLDTPVTFISDQEYDYSGSELDPYEMIKKADNKQVIQIRGCITSGKGRIWITEPSQSHVMSSFGDVGILYFYSNKNGTKRPEWTSALWGDDVHDRDAGAMAMAYYEDAENNVEAPFIETVSPIISSFKLEQELDDKVVEWTYCVNNYDKVKFLGPRLAELQFKRPGSSVINKSVRTTPGFEAAGSSDFNNYLEAIRRQFKCDLIGYTLTINGRYYCDVAFYKGHNVVCTDTNFQILRNMTQEIEVTNIRPIRTLGELRTASVLPTYWTVEATESFFPEHLKEFSSQSAGWMIGGGILSGIGSAIGTWQQQQFQEATQKRNLDYLTTRDELNRLQQQVLQAQAHQYQQQGFWQRAGVGATAAGGLATNSAETSSTETSKDSTTPNVTPEGLSVLQGNQDKLEASINYKPLVQVSDFNLDEPYVTSSKVAQKPYNGPMHTGPPIPPTNVGFKLYHKISNPNTIENEATQA